MSEEKLDAAKVGTMFVTSVHFKWKGGGECYNHATLKVVEQGIGQKLAEILLPVIMEDAARKAQKLHEESQAMLKALGERAVCCITDMPSAAESAKQQLSKEQRPASGDDIIIADVPAE